MPGHSARHLLLLVAVLIGLGDLGVTAFGGEPDSLNRRATYLDGKVGSHAVLNCPLDFPQDDPIPYVLRWFKDVRMIFRSSLDLYEIVFRHTIKYYSTAKYKSDACP